MDRMTFEAIVESVDGLELTRYNDGGGDCVGIACDRPYTALIDLAVACMSSQAEFSGMCILALKRVQIDQLGMGHMMYWPAIPWIEI